MSVETLTPSGYPWPTDPQPTGLRDLNEVEETAAYLRCGRTHIFALIRSGQLASVKVGRKRLIPATAIRAYVEGLA